MTAAIKKKDASPRATLHKYFVFVTTLNNERIFIYVAVLHIVSKEDIKHNTETDKNTAIKQYKYQAKHVKKIYLRWQNPLTG